MPGLLLKLLTPFEGKQEKRIYANVFPSFTKVNDKRIAVFCTLQRRFSRPLHNITVSVLISNVHTSETIATLNSNVQRSSKRQKGPKWAGGDCLNFKQTFLNTEGQGHYRKKKSYTSSSAVDPRKLEREAPRRNKCISKVLNQPKV